MAGLINEKKKTRFIFSCLLQLHVYWLLVHVVISGYISGVNRRFLLQEALEMDKDDDEDDHGEKNDDEGDERYAPGAVH